jgi:hypothetical protein
MSAGEREVLISGSHARCFDEAFKDPEEEVAIREPKEGIDYNYVSPYQSAELPPFIEVDEDIHYADDEITEQDRDDELEMYPHDEHVGLDLPEGYGS